MRLKGFVLTGVTREGTHRHIFYPFSDTPSRDRHLEFARTSGDLGEAAIPPWRSGTINRNGYSSPTCDDRT